MNERWFDCSSLKWCTFHRFRCRDHLPLIHASFPGRRYPAGFQLCSIYPLVARCYQFVILQPIAIVSRPRNSTVFISCRYKCRVCTHLDHLDRLISMWYSLRKARQHKDDLLLVIERLMLLPFAAQGTDERLIKDAKIEAKGPQSFLTMRSRVYRLYGW